MAQVKEYHINNSSISIYFGNILQTKADVIVSSDDTNITMGGGVSGPSAGKKELVPSPRMSIKKHRPK